MESDLPDDRASRAPSFAGRRSASPAASRIKKRNRKSGGVAERTLRKLLWGRGVRYRLGGSGLAGRPDLVFRRHRLAVFVDGDFWHGRDWEDRLLRLKKGNNAAYWVAKIEYNRIRDRRNNALLAQSGWTVVRLWETDVLRNPAAAADSVCAALSP